MPRKVSDFMEMTVRADGGNSVGTERVTVRVYSGMICIEARTVGMEIIMGSEEVRWLRDKISGLINSTKFKRSTEGCTSKNKRRYKHD